MSVVTAFNLSERLRRSPCCAFAPQAKRIASSRLPGVAIWLMNGFQILGEMDISNVPPSWSIVGTGDFNGDGYSDILWRNTDGDVAIWLMNGFQLGSGMDIGTPQPWFEHRRMVIPLTQACLYVVGAARV